MFPGLKVKSRVGLLLLLLSFIEEVSGWGCFIGFWNVNLPVITEVFFPLRSMEAEVLIVDGIADVKFKQWFDVVPNPPDTSFPDDWKTKYVIPIPDAGAIYAFQGSYEVGGVLRVVEGEVKGKEQAEQEFNDAVESGKPAFLGEESDAGEFLIQFGNVPLNVEVVIELRYAIEVEVLDREKFRWVFPQGLAPTMDAFVGTAAEIASLPYDNGAFNLFLTACSSSGSITASSPSHSTMVTGTSTSECKDLSLRDTAQDRKDIILLFETLKVQDVQVSFQPGMKVLHFCFHN